MPPPAAPLPPPAPTPAALSKVPSAGHLKGAQPSGWDSDKDTQEADAAAPADARGEERGIADGPVGDMSNAVPSGFDDDSAEVSALQMDEPAKQKKGEAL